MPSYHYSLLTGARQGYVLKKKGSCYSLNNPPFLARALQDFLEVKEFFAYACSGEVLDAFEEHTLSRSMGGLVSTLWGNDVYHFQCAGSAEKREYSPPDFEAKMRLHVMYVEEDGILLNVRDRNRVDLDLYFTLREDDGGEFAFSILEKLRKVSMLRFPDGYELKNYSTPGSLADFRRSRIHSIR